MRRPLTLVHWGFAPPHLAPLWIQHATRHFASSPQAAATPAHPGALAKARLAQLSHALELGRPQYLKEQFDPTLGYRMRLDAPSGESFTSGFHLVKKEAEYEIATTALREAKCFQVHSVPKEQQRLLPLLAFTGRVTVVKDLDTAHAALSAFRSQMDRFPVMGFDTETQPHFYRPARAVAQPQGGTEAGKAEPLLPDLLQIASEDHAVIFHMRHLANKLPEPLSHMLADESIMKIGAGITGDTALLRRFCPQPQLNSFVDLASFARKFFAYPHGLQSLTSIFLQGRLSKRQQLSDWGAHELSPAQLSYAATDAWVAVEIYRAICQRDELMSHARIRTVLSNAGLQPDLFIPGTKR